LLVVAQKGNNFTEKFACLRISRKRHETPTLKRCLAKIHLGALKLVLQTGGLFGHFSARSADRPSIVGTDISRGIAVPRPHLEPGAGRADNVDSRPLVDLRDYARG
jgi:hypothetical protein